MKAYYIESSDWANTGWGGYVGDDGKLRQDQEVFTSVRKAVKTAAEYAEDLQRTRFTDKNLYYNEECADKECLVEVYVYERRGDDECDDDRFVVAIA